MRPKETPFQFEDFVILNSTCTFIPSKNQITNPKEILIKYPVDIDFTFRKQEDKVIMLCKVSVNQSNDPLPGYSLFVEGLGIFDQAIGADIKGQDHVFQVQAPAVSYGITQIRNTILLLTSQGPFGKYQLPIFSVRDLFNKKFAQQKKKTTPEKGEKDTKAPTV